MMPTWRILLLSLAFIGIVGLAMWAAIAYQPTDNNKGGNGYKRLSGTVAEGFVYRVGREKHPRATCSACRVGKMKLGLISLGAFNTIELDDLIINVPDASPSPIQDRQNGSQQEKSDADLVVDALNLKPVMAMARAEAKKFAGVKISKIQINKMSGDSLLPLVHAESLKNSGKRLMFHNVILHKDGQEQKLSEVELKVKPRLKLIWSSGSWDLTDMLSPLL